MKITIDGCKASKIFVLEDSKDRIEWFKRKFGYAHQLYITKDVKKALEILNEVKFDLVFLDHDLEEISIYDEANPEFVCEQNGLLVAKELRGTLNGLTECIIHSMNPNGAASMIAAHPFNSVHIPFHILRDELEVKFGGD